MPEKISDENLIAALIDLFRSHGFEGVSIARVSAATGLQKSSLYHRFPGGKEQMADEVLKAANKEFYEHVLAPLRAEGPPARRVRETAKRLATFYADGHKSCLLDTLSIGPSARSTAPELLKAGHDGIIASLAAVAKEAGASSKEASRRAADALVRLEGALVVGRLTGEPTEFRRVLKELPTILGVP